MADRGGAVNREETGWVEQDKWCVDFWNGVNHLLQGPASALPGDWTDQGSVWQGERDRVGEEDRKREVYQYIGIWSSDCVLTKVENHSVSTCRVKGWIAKVMIKHCADMWSRSVSVDKAEIKLQNSENVINKTEIICKLVKYEKNVRV